MTSKEKHKVMSAIEAYKAQLEEYCNKGWLVLAERCKNKLWGATQIAYELDILNTADVTELDAWADEMVSALYREQYITGKGAAPCRGNT